LDSGKAKWQDVYNNKGFTLGYNGIGLPALKSSWCNAKVNRYKPAQVMSSSNERRSRAERRNGPCELCGRERFLTFHHLIPRTLHGKKRFRKLYPIHEMRARGLFLCGQCHGGIHDLLTEKELGETYNTRDALLNHEGVSRHVAWARKQK
jgi:hypothetical protein